jgi:hypothetical protein
MGTGGPYPGGKARLGRDADHSPPSSAEVEKEQELYLLSTQEPSWRVMEQLQRLALTYLKAVSFPASKRDFILSD